MTGRLAIEAHTADGIDRGVGISLGLQRPDRRAALELLYGALHLVDEVLATVQTGKDGTSHQAACSDIALPVIAQDDTALTELIGTMHQGRQLRGIDLREGHGDDPAKEGVSGRISARIAQIILIGRIACRLIIHYIGAQTLVVFLTGVDGLRGDGIHAVEQSVQLWRIAGRDGLSELRRERVDDILKRCIGIPYGHIATGRSTDGLTVIVGGDIIVVLGRALRGRIREVFRGVGQVVGIEIGLIGPGAGLLFRIFILCQLYLIEDA